MGIYSLFSRACVFVCLLVFLCLFFLSFFNPFFRIPIQPRPPWWVGAVMRQTCRNPTCPTETTTRCKAESCIERRRSERGALYADPSPGRPCFPDFRTYRGAPRFFGRGAPTTELPTVRRILPPRFSGSDGARPASLGADRLRMSCRSSGSSLMCLFSEWQRRIPRHWALPAYGRVSDPSASPSRFTGCVETHSESSGGVASTEMPARRRVFIFYFRGVNHESFD